MAHAVSSECEKDAQKKHRKILGILNTMETCFVFLVSFWFNFGVCGPYLSTSWNSFHPRNSKNGYVE